MPELTKHPPNIDELNPVPRKIYSTEELASMKDRGLSLSEIGKIIGRSKQAVSQRLKAHGISIQEAEVFKKDRSAILRHKQKLLLESIDKGVISKMSGKDRFISLGIAIDKEMMLEGKAVNSIISIIGIATKAEAAQGEIDVTPADEVVE